MAELESVDGVTGVETLADGRLRVRFSGHSPAERLVRLSVEHDWGLTELTPENRSLEQIFMTLTHADHGREAAA
jgi:ABC-2 type transport system ATP-binding protein